MGKFKYIINRIKDMNFKNYFKTIDDVHKKCHKPRIIIFFDTIICGFKYQAGYMDYQLFEMYNMTKEERKTIVTRGINNDIMKKYNQKEYLKFFRDKYEFNKKFDKYLLRDWLYLDGNNIDEFKTFLKGKKEIIVKPNSGTCGKGIEKISVNDYNPKELYDMLIQDGRVLVEEEAKQCKIISDLHPSSINTVRVVTLNGSVVATFLRMGNKGYVVDNFNHEGLAAPIDIKTGIINYKAIDKQHNEYSIHPYTNKKIVGLKIPMWNEVIKLCKEASQVIPEVGYVGWDVCIGVKKPFLIEGNEFPGHDIYQLPPHREGNIGLLPVFIKAMEEGKNE